MTIAAARQLHNGTVCFVGIGLPSTAANLARVTHAPDVVLIYESGTIGAKLAVTRGGQTVELEPLYKLNPASHQVETPPVQLPGGGAMIFSGIDATNHTVQLEAAGVASVMKLSVDVTRKPLIQLVWFGLYVVILGGALSSVQRLREMRVRERVAEAKQAGGVGTQASS